MQLPTQRFTRLPCVEEPSGWSLDCLYCHTGKPAQAFLTTEIFNWNLGANHLPEVYWNGWKGREERGEGDKLKCLLPLSSFVLWSAC
jgi:hypothetical protein